MKAFLIILVIALGAAAAWIQNSADKAKKAHAEEVADLEAELDIAEDAAKDAKKALTKAQAELEKVKGQLAAKGTEPKSQPLVLKTNAAPATESQTAAAPAAPAVNVGARLEEIERIYQQQKRTLDEKSAILTRNLSVAQSARNEAAKPLEFAEQSDRISSSGAFLGKKGVRTSQADRDEAKRLQSEKVAQLDANIAAILAAQDTLQLDYQTLERDYTDAKIKAEAGQ